MSRQGAAKTRGADKSRPPAAQTPVIAHEIVPGKFNDNDWNNMLAKDSTEDFITDIVEELMDNTMTIIFNDYIERQLLPFTITQARDAIVEIIEWQFLARDEGELYIDTDLGWAQDEGQMRYKTKGMKHNIQNQELARKIEPEPAVTDCWAQGSMPKNIIAAPVIASTMEEIPEEPEPEAVAEVPPVEEAPQEPEELPDVVSDTEEATPAEAQEEGEEENLEKSSSSSSVTNTASKGKFHPYRGKLKSAGVSKMTESLEETEMLMMYEEIAASQGPSEEKPSILLNMPASCSSILKVQTGRPPGNKDVVYDDYGNVMAVMKLDPEKLPTHKVNVKYHVVDPAVEAAQARLDAMRKGKSTGSKVKRTRMKTSSMDSIQGGSKSKPARPTSTVAPLPPPLKGSVMSLKSSTSDFAGRQTLVIEEMEVSHGVIVREGGRVKKGPGRYYRKLDILEDSQKGMKPVSLKITNPGITVADLLDRHTPILRPLGEASPLPPIVPQPPQQPQQVS